MTPRETGDPPWSRSLWHHQEELRSHPRSAAFKKHHLTNTRVRKSFQQQLLHTCKAGHWMLQGSCPKIPVSPSPCQPAPTSHLPSPFGWQNLLPSQNSREIQYSGRLTRGRWWGGRSYTHIVFPNSSSSARPTPTLNSRYRDLSKGPGNNPCSFSPLLSSPCWSPHPSTSNVLHEPEILPLVPPVRGYCSPKLPKEM